nr:indolepyruvate ferredoxin oxidoreductase subunit alpha [Candidatus Freyrarchaeum guaymaensis]
MWMRGERYVGRTFRKFTTYDVVRDEPGAVVLLNGNEAVARGAIEAGVTVATGYPGSPATYILENLALAAERYDIHAEWSTNEMVAYEVAFGAAATGAKAIASMKNVGMNWIMDPLRNSVGLEIKGALVVAVVDDPGSDVTTNEQDSRYLARFAEVPVFTPATIQEAKDLTVEAFRFSEELSIPVVVCPTRQLVYARGNVTLGPVRRVKRRAPRLEKNFRFVTGLGVMAVSRHRKHHAQTLKRLDGMVDGLSWNELKLDGDEEVGVIASGLPYSYVAEALDSLPFRDDVAWLKVATPYPLPKGKVAKLLKSVNRVLVLEEVEPFIEEQVMALTATIREHAEVLGKSTGHVPVGELDRMTVKEALCRVYGVPYKPTAPPEHIARAKQAASKLPFRPFVSWCPGCPHLASYYSLKKAVRKLFGKNYNVHGEIGCYQMAILPPVEMVDTCICMGSSTSVGCGVYHAGAPGKNIATMGDSSFFHASIPALINAVYNKADITVIVLDNRTTGATGHQPHPGAFGVTATGEPTRTLDVAEVARACGVDLVEVVDPYNLKETQEAMERALSHKGVSVVVCRRVCAVIAVRQKGGVTSPEIQKYRVDEGECTNCRKCMELGCPSLYIESREDKPKIDRLTCVGCGVCGQICPVGAIKPEE